MCSIQSSLLLLYYVVFSVMSVPQYSLCVTRIQCTVTVFSVSPQRRRLSSIAAFNASRIPTESIASVQFLKRSVCNYGRGCSIHSQWCSVLAGLQSTAFMVCPLLLFSISSVQSSIQLSVGFRVYSVQYTKSLSCSCRIPESTL